MKPIFAILVTYKRFEYFKQTVESLIPTLPAGSMLAIVVNGDDAETYAYVRDLTSMEKITAPGAVTIKVLLTGTNEGWGSSMNEGLHVYGEWKGYEYVLETNNDVTFEPDWCQRAQVAMEAHPEIGILGGFKHPYHGVRTTLSDGVIVKDDMPACAWFMRSSDLEQFLPFPEHGPCKTRGGNGEDTAFRDKVQNKMGRWIAGLEPDWAHHMDGYDIPDLGKENPAYL